MKGQTGVNISILIAVESHSARICHTLESLSECERPESKFSVVVVENGDKKCLEKEIVGFQEKLPVVYGFTTNRGKSAGLNYGIKNLCSTADFIIFTDDDIRFKKDWIRKYEVAFKKWGTGHYFGCAFKVEYEEPPDPLWKAKLPRSARGADDSLFACGNKKTFFGCNWAATRKDLCAAGLFDGDYGPGSRTGATGQETNMQNRLRQNGIQEVFVPNNPVWHFVPKEKCSPEWVKERAKRIGIEQCLKTDNRFRWVRCKTGTLLAGMIGCLFGRRESRVAATVDWIKLKSFLGCWWRDRSRDS